MLTPTSALIGYFGSGEAPPLLTDGRFSGGSHGILVAHLADAYRQDSVTRVIKDGDDIEICADKCSVSLLVGENEINKRLEEMPLKDKSLEVGRPGGFLSRYAKMCGTFETGYLCE